MTIYDISEKAGVSIATVSRVLNGSSSVSEKTRQKVLAIMEKYDYTPNAFARGLGLNTMHTIGILCADSSDLYLSKAIYYMEQKLRDNHYDSLLCCTGYALENKRNSLHLLLSKKVDGIILVGSDFVNETLAENNYIKEAAKEVPIMILNAILDYPNVYSIAADDYRSVYEATSTLISSGIQDILYFYNAKTYSGIKKLSGYQDAIKDSGLPLSSSLMQYYDGPRENISDIIDLLEKLSNTGTKFHGVIASDDTLALAALKYARKNNLKVPDDFAVIGYNNSFLTACCDPELTSIDNQLEVLCNELIHMLMEVLSGNYIPPQTVFPCNIVKRGTTRF